MISAFGVEHGFSKSLKPAHIEALSRSLRSKSRPVREYADGRLANNSMQWGAARDVKSNPTSRKPGPSDKWRTSTRYDRINNKRATKLSTNTPYRQGGHVKDTRGRRVLP